MLFIEDRIENCQFVPSSRDWTMKDVFYWFDMVRFTPQSRPRQGHHRRQPFTFVLHGRLEQTGEKISTVQHFTKRRVLVKTKLGAFGQLLGLVLLGDFGGCASNRHEREHRKCSIDSIW